MLSTMQVNQIKDLHSRGYKQTEICNITGRDPKTVRKYVNMTDFSTTPPEVTIPIAFITPSTNNENDELKLGWDTPTKPSKLDPYKRLIDQWLEEDKKTFFKQHHTSRQIYNRLRVETGYDGSYTLVQKHVKKLREDMKKSRPSLELIWCPGDAQLDFGDVEVIEVNPDGSEKRVMKKFMVLNFPFSATHFVQIFSGEAVECVCQGLLDIFHFIQGVPKRIVMDSSTGAGGLKNNQIYESDLFQRFKAHYGFEVTYHSNYVPQGKGAVERMVQTIRKTEFVPIKTIIDIEEFNQQLLYGGDVDRLFIHDQPQVNTLYFEDFRALGILPHDEFDVCSYSYATADGYGRITIDGVHKYLSRPEYSKRKDILVGVRAHFVDIYEYGGHILVRHKREFGDEPTVTRDFSVTIDLLLKRPGAWFCSGIRYSMSDELVAYMDSRTVAERRSILVNLKEMTALYGLEATICAFDTALHDGKLDVPAARYLSGYIATKHKKNNLPFCPDERDIVFIEELEPSEAAELLEGL